MNELQFWTIIDNAQSHADPLASIKSELSRLERSDIIRFHEILAQKIAGACTFPLLAANFVIESYVSDDGFRAFRAWLVAQGSAKYNCAIADPESIADWLDKNAVDEIDGDVMEFIACEAYDEKYGSYQELLKRARIESDPPLIEDWPPNKSEYQKKFPKLVAKFWNKDRIRELHPD